MPTPRADRPKKTMTTRASAVHDVPRPVWPRSVLAAWRQRCLVGQAMALALWNAPAFAQNMITPDGRTQTNVSVSGATTTITTQTISGGAGYNSFSRFEQVAGTTVNMHLPQNTGALVNIVRDGPVVVNGILNSYRNGQIGGHVYFSDSAGFTVGPSGVINTGRLTVNTPTREFLDGVIGPNGVVNEALAARLRANDVPISPDGAITIDGRINARRGVTLNGNSVSVAGQITANAAPVDIGERRQRHQAAFAQSVNTTGVQHGGALVARRGGGIEIVAAGAAQVSGTLSANATGRRAAGTVAVRSGKGTTITQTARISATGAAPSARPAGAATAQPAVNTGDGGTVSITSEAAISIAPGARFDVSAAQDVAGRGGDIKVLAGTRLDVGAGASFKGNAGLSGDGGFLELSAKKTVAIDAVDVDLSAKGGKAGTFLIDPEDLVINSAQISVNGANVILQADNSITIAAGGSIDTRQFNRQAGALSAANPSTGNSGSITLDAPNITVAGSLLANVVNGGGTSYSAGDITLDASKSHVVIAGLAQATSKIEVTGTITGRDVKLLADATAVASYTDPGVALVALVEQSAASVLLGLNGGYVASTVESRVNIGGTAVITGTRDVVLSAKARQEASMPAMTLAGNTPLGAAVVVGEINGVVATDVANGATINAGRNLSVTAQNDVTLATSALSVSSGQTRVNVTAAYGFVDVATSAIVHSGAAITVGSGGDVVISAINENSFSTSATAAALSGGVAGVSVAYSDITAKADARLGASIARSGSALDDVTVEAISNTSKNATSSSVMVGDNMLTGFTAKGVGITAELNTLFGKLSSLTSASSLGKFGSSVTYAKSDLGASAAIAADAGASPAQIPSIVAGGDVVVASRQYDFAVRVSADSGINSESTNPVGSNPSATIAVSAGVVYGDFRHSSTASIGSGVAIDANHIGVGATNEMPISNTWLDWAGLGQTISHLNGTLGVVSNILTSYANATSESTQLGLAGSVNYYTVKNDTSAYVASGARLYQRSGYGEWTSTLGDGSWVTWDKGVSVQAKTVTESIDVAGNFGLFSLTGTSGGAGSAVGGSFLDLGRSSSTVAAIAAGATLDVSELAVSATTADRIFAIAPTSGKAAGDVAANGIVTLLGLNNHTLASISNEADVTAINVSVEADQLVSLFSLTGAVAYSGANGIGVSVAALDAAAVTRAYIGDNSGDLSDGRLGSGYGQGLITARNLDVAAQTYGRITAAAVAAAFSDPNASKLSILKSGWSAFKNALGKGDVAARAAGSGAVSLSAAGSAAFAMTTLGTSAWIDDAVLANYSSGGLYTNVQALNSTIAEIAAGSAALNLARNSSPLSGALAGAVALGIFDNSTDARIADSSLTGIDDLAVQAVSGGRATVVGVSIAAARPNSGAAAVSAAVGLVTNSANASIADSAVTGRSLVPNPVRVNAYQSTDIGIGGGAMYAGAQAGLGIAVTYASITDPSGRDAVGASVSNSSLVNLVGLEVTATSISRIVSGAIAGGGGPDSNGLAGAFVINEVSPTIRASVTGRSGAIPSIRLSGGVSVMANGVRNAALDAVIAERDDSTDLGQIDFTARNANGGAANADGASIVAMAGTLQAGQNNAGVSLLINTIAQSHIATIELVDLIAGGDVAVRAVDGSIITGIAIGIGAASGQFAGTASVVTQSIDNTILARIGGSGTQVTSGGDLTVMADAASAIRGSAGSLGMSIGAAAVGLSIVDDSIANSVSAEVDDARLRASRDVSVRGRSTADIRTTALGLAMSRNVGLAGAVANNSIASDVGALVTGADIIAANNLGVIATNSDGITVWAAALGVTAAGVGVAGGVTVVNNTIGGATTAAIGENSIVDAYAAGSNALLYEAGQLQSAFDLSSANSPSAAPPSLAMTQRSIRGLGVVATSQQSVLANAVTGGVAAFPITGAVAIVPISNVLGGSTSATIDASLVDTRLTGTGSTAVTIDAASHSYAATFITVGAIGGVAASGANANTVMERSTKAALTRSTTGTTTPGYIGSGVSALDVAATSSQSATSNVSGFALGLGGAAALGVVNSFEALTSASLDQGLVTAGRVGVTADSRNGFYAQTVVVAAGGVGVGGAFIVGTSRNATLATVGGGSGQTVFNLNGGLAVAATSRNAFTTLAAGGAAGGFAGVAGMVSFVDVENETRAGLYGVSATLRPGATQVVNGVTSAAGVSVTANEATSITPTTAAGANGSFGAGAAANIASLDSRVLADILNSTLVAPGTVSAWATSDRTVSAQTVTYGIGGSAGIGASVALISVGTGTPSGAQGEINAGGNGTLSRVNQLTAGNADLVLGASGLAAYRSYRGTAGAAMSDSALRDAAQAEYNLLLANGTVSGSAITLTSSGIAALRSAAATALGIANPSDAQVSTWAATRYAALTNGKVGYLLSDAGVGAYRDTVVATTPDASEDQIRAAANDAYARLLANGTVANGVLTLSAAGIAAYRAEASAGLDDTATDAQVRDYAARQYAFFNANRSRIAAPASQSVAGLLDTAGSATKATVTGGSISSGSVAATALSRTATSNLASGVGAGGAAGVGAATAYTDIGDAVSARLDQITVTTGTIAVSAASTDGAGSAARIEARAGAGALGAAAGAAVADGSVSNNVTATLGGTFTATGATTVNASNSQTGRSDAFGATVAGGLALGISLASSSADSTVAATYSAGSNLTGTGLTIGATSGGAAYAAAVAGAGGLLAAGSGAEANATDNSRVSATIGSGARANVGAGAITISASASPDAKAAAVGVAVAGGLAVGAAIANATANPWVLATIEANASLPVAQFTAGSLSVLATGSIFGTAAGDASRLADATSGFSRGGFSAQASAVAGSGAYYVSAVGTDARARNTASVTASVGDYVRLPRGTVTVSASNTTAQGATATGITAGTAAVGTVNAQADADTDTTASLGEGVTLAGAGAGSFTLTATGSDTQIARAQAGSGGLYAGSGATGSTSNLSDVTASTGANVVIDSGIVTIAASHSTRYGAIVDSLQAAALGASAALARNTADVDVLTSLGAGSRITASGPNTAGCYLSSCLQAISLTSRNAFTQLDLGESVRAAAGGGINGAGATSETEIDGTSKVLLGNSVDLIAGLGPTAAPGPILVQAWTELTADDTATLTTGGLLQGAGVTSQYDADVDNEVTVGTGSELNSFGVINLGTYTTASVKTNAYVSTYGLASVGLADADTTIITNNTIAVGANSTLLGLYDVNVTAGRDGSGLRSTSLSGRATALGYVRGLIAVPDADASTNLQNHALVTIGSGAAIASAQNVTLGAYNGILDPHADGTGHGYQLYFIPVTEGSSSPGASSTSRLVMNGAATAGIYNTQRIEVGCGATASVQCGPNETPTIRFISGAPVTATYNPAFNTVAYINANYDASVAGTLIAGVNSSPVKAVRLSQLYAAGGNIFVNAGTVEGSGTLTANGGPSITVINRSNAYLVLDGGAYIPESTGGQIVGSSGPLTRHTNPDATPVITIDNSYTGALDASGHGSALLIGGDITNLAGVVSLNNTQGSFGFSGQRIDALQFNTTVPNGAVVVSSNGPNGMYTAGAAPQAEYGSYIYYPGGGPGDASFNVDQAVYAAANALAAGQGATDLNYFLYGRQDEGTSRNFSMQFYGNCIGYIGDAGYACTGGYDMGNNIRFMVIPTLQTYRASNPVAQGGGTKIYGAQVAIKATTININASIEAGRITDWQGTIGGNVGDILRNSRQSWLDDGYTTISFASIFGGGWAAANAVPISYDVVNNRLVMADVNASSGGGSVLLDGQIISTNTIGNIKVNGGFGNVSVNNASGLDLVTSRINTGTAAGVNGSVSKITIIDRLITSGLNTKIYAYTPGSGIAVYKTMNGALPSSGPVEFISGDTARYDPVAGTRYEWTQQILLQKEGLTPQNTQTRDLVSYWRYDSGTSSNPWVYVDAQSPSTNPGADWMYWWSRNAQAPSATAVSGRITNDTNLIGVGLTQEITGGQLDFINNEAHYTGCNLQAINHCDRDFVAQPGATSAVWNYQMVTRAFVQVTASVKADNSFGISFAGNASGTVNINSNSSVLLQGNIVNPSGTTTINASAGSITQAANVSILSNNLTLTARDSIGTAAQAIETTLTSGAQLSATTGSGGINLDITGGARVVALRADGNPNAYGDIKVHATGSLEAVATGTANVVGRNIRLRSDEGSIGSVSNLMTMRAVATQLPNGTYVDGVVNVSARGDVGIAQLAGDLRVGEIRSEAGNVRIDVNAGRLVSASGQTAAQALSADQLSHVSQALKLTAADGAGAAAQGSVAAFETQVTQSYAQYSALVRNGTVALVDTDGDGVNERVFTLNAAAIPLYQAFADAERKSMAEPGEVVRAATPDEVLAYAKRRYAAYGSVFDTAFGDGWASQARFNPATLESNYSFSANAADVAPGLATRITGDAVWTERQLVSAINQSALQPASGVVGNGTALVIGHDVTLNIAGSIGSLAPDMQVALSDIRNGSISNAQLAALAVATTPGTVKIMGQKQDGSLVEVADLRNVPAGVTLVRVDVKQTTPLFINATGTFSGSAQGDIYLQSTSTPNSAGGTLTVGHVSATGTINLQAPQAIAVATNPNGTPRSSVQIETNGDLVLVAGGGGIGSAATPLTYRIGGKLVSASAAAGDAYLVATGGTATVGRIFASATASLTATNGGIQGYLPGVAISANSILLNATGNVGSASAALGLQGGATGEVSGQIGGYAYLSAPTLAGQSPGALRVGALDATSGLTLTADGEIRVLRSARSSSGALSLTGGKIGMASGADIRTAGRATLASGSDITLGRVVSGLVAPAGTASIVLTAAGSILGNGDAGTLLDASQAGGVISLYAGTGIGSATSALAFAAPGLSARGLAGGVYLATAAGTHATSLAADVGAAELTAGGDLTVDALTSGGGATLSTSNGRLTLGTLNAGGASSLDATGAILIASARTTAGDLSVTSTGAGISAGTIDADGAATLTATGSISVTTSLTAGGAANATAAGGTLGIASLEAGASSALAASGLVTLGDATTTTGDLAVTSTGAGITAATLETAGIATLGAGGAISVTTSLTSGGATNATAGGALAVASFEAGATSTLSGADGVTLGDAVTRAGDVTITSSGAGIAATTIDAAGAAVLSAAGAISVTTLTTGGAANVATTGGPLGIAGLEAGATSALSAAGAISLGSAITSAGNLTVTSTTAGITAATIDTAGDATLAAATSVSITDAVRAGGAVSVTAINGAIDAGDLTAGGSLALSSSAALALTAVSSRGNVSLTSTGAGISVATIDAAGSATLTAAGAISITSSLIAGGTVTVTTADALSMADLEAGANSALSASGAVTLGSARTTAGDLTVVSSAGDVSAASLTTAATAWVNAAGALEIAALTVGADAVIEAGGQARLTTARTERGDLSVFAGSIDAATLRSGRALMLVASGPLALGSGEAATDATARSTVGGATITTLAAGRAATVEAFGPVALGTVSAGALTATSHGDGIAAASLRIGGDATLSGYGAVSVQEFSARDVAASSSAGTLGIATLDARGSATLRSALDQVLGTARVSGDAMISGSAVSIGSLTTTAGALDLASTRGAIVADVLDVAGAATLDAATSLTLTRMATAGPASLAARDGLTVANLVAGGDLGLRSANGGITATELSSGGGAMLAAAETISVGQLGATASAWLRSTRADITATRVSTGADATLAASGLLSIASLGSGGAATLTADRIAAQNLIAGRGLSASGRGTIGIESASVRSGDIALVSEAGAVRGDSFDATGAVTVQAAGDIALGGVRSGADASLSSRFAMISLGSLSAGRDAAVQAQAIDFRLIDAGRSASLSAEGAINGGRIAVTDALTLQAGSSGAGSIAIDLGGARVASVRAPDEVRLSRFGAGDSITILGTRIAADIVQLPAGGSLPLALDIGGARSRTAESVDLAVEAQRFRIGRFEAVDGRVRTSSNQFGIAGAFVPGALRLTTPIMTVLANNRSIAPVTGYDVQLFQKDRPFYVTVDGKRLTSNAFFVDFDADVVDIPPSVGFSLVRDMARLGTVLPTGPSFAEAVRGFVLGGDGRWRSSYPETTGSLDTARGIGAPLVNLDGAEGQP